ncbi:MAG TPA: chemotaxis protein CheB [Dehalococcoidales bacterium]|nr:chemotaxis protein CheB [Dehalococcoidales bacterium]
MASSDKEKNEKELVKEPKAPKKEPGNDDFPVIGLGASAGGLDAFSKFFSAMPPNTGMAFVLIQHLDPTHASNMVELLKRYTPMPVHEATENIKLQPGHVYMIPPNRNMTITDRTLKLMEQSERPGIMHSIDLFFRSLASDLKEKAICIILSGTGSDGSLGAKAVKAELGMVMVQEPESAGYDGMPRAAMAAGVADFILPPEAMAKHLIEYVTKSYGKRALRRRAVEKDSSSIPAILSLIRARTKHDFTGYKQATISRRIERRMGISQIDNISHYQKFLHEHPAEVDSLVKDFLINVTSFFRDPEAFTVLRECLKKALEDKPEGAEIRAWVPGCSTGEEAYSLMMTIEEVLEELKKYCVVQVFGTDLDNDAIAIARTGIYPASIVQDVGEERIKKFFTRKDDQVQIKRELREKLVFAVQDIIADPPFTRMDIISARNLLIYFDGDLQKKLVPMFHYALNQNGLLFLGTAETVGEFAELFVPVDRKWKIYRAEIKEKHPPFTLPTPSWTEPVEVKLRGKYAAAHPNQPSRTPEQVMLEALPASILVDGNYQVLYSHGDTRKYLGFPEGRPNNNILEIVHPELRAYISSALHEAVLHEREIIREGARVKLNSHTQAIKITVKPVVPTSPGEPPGRLIISFQDVLKPKSHSKKSDTTDTRVSELEQELQFSKETLRSTIEELETANEELRSANEEYQSTNEELQSTNEELETSREELQSVNEELSTVNAEHQAKIDELSTVNDDMKNLLNSMPIATIYLDNDLKVKRFTPAATGIFNLIATDVDRPISHITSQIGDYNIAEKAKKVLDTLLPFQDSVQSKEGKWYSMRILPYRTTDNAIAGVVVTFVDISEQERLKLALTYAEAINDTLMEPVIVLDNELKVISANRAFYELFKMNRGEVEQKLLYELDGQRWAIPELKKLLEKILPKNTELRDYELEADFPRVGKHKLALNARRLSQKDGTVQRIVLAIHNVTEQAKK